MLGVELRQQIELTPLRRARDARIDYVIDQSRVWFFRVDVRALVNARQKSRAPIRNI